MSDKRMHALSMASATHLHKHGHITGAQKDKIHAKAQAAMGKPRMAPAAAAPMGLPPMIGSLAPPPPGPAAPGMPGMPGMMPVGPLV